MSFYFFYILFQTYAGFQEVETAVIFWKISA